MFSVGVTSAGNKIVVCGEVVWMRLTRGKWCAISREDLPLLDTLRWHAVPADRTFYVRTRLRAGGVIDRVIPMHHVLLCPHMNTVDHINGNGLDNRRSNLRYASPLDQSRNTRLRRDSKTGFKGVSVFGDRFRATIRVAGNLLSLGVHCDSESAAMAYDAAATKYFGSFAKTNKALGLL